jgi:quinolinate synthase
MSVCFRRRRNRENKSSSPRVELPPEIIQRARLPIERMLEISVRPIENAG